MAIVLQRGAIRSSKTNFFRLFLTKLEQLQWHGHLMLIQNFEGCFTFAYICTSMVMNSKTCRNAVLVIIAAEAKSLFRLIARCAFKVMAKPSKYLS